MRRTSALLSVLACVISAAVGCGGKSAPGAVSTSTADVVPATTTIPAAAWADRNRLPLAETQHWPSLDTVARPLSDGTSRIYQLCQTAPADQERWQGDDAARARVDNGAQGWSLQQQIIHYPGDTWTMGQAADALFTALENALSHCATTAPGAQVTITSPASRCEDIARGRCVRLAATIEIPDKQTSAHVYLSSPGSSVSELSLWSSGASHVAWSAPSDREVFAAMNPQLCTVWEC
ncbi:hypothetical protein MSP7336_01171 [Mycobacterium shimoidei]|uniref:Uncharacterized protein n=1 Tax=Mycobacterium shimoidei TaxID=29313 RepID=A0A375YVT7_MYCSH|nr:hypothetical protein [Mycobacterium shimoidei]SRX92942.1 hypothetical protein MSP7336_01171 [Mycobacterium shimoidei]